MSKNSKLKIAQEKAQNTINNTNEKIALLGEHTSKLYEALTSIQGLFDIIRNIPTEQKYQYEELKRIRLNWKQQAEKIDHDYKEATAKNVGAGAAGAGLGVAVVAMGPTVAMGVATTFGVASTGTAISTLSGAAATNAALAWLGGGALAAGGGGMAAGNAFLALAGPVGWTIAGVSLAASAIMFFKTRNDKKQMEDLFTLISERDIKHYELAIVELNERISRIINETSELNSAIAEIQTFGKDYNEMTEHQQYALGSYVNLMSSSTQLLVNPILGLQPAITDEDFRNYTQSRFYQILSAIRKYDAPKFSTPIVSLANLLYKVELDDKDIKLLSKSLKHNKKFLKSVNLEKCQVEDCVNLALDVINYKTNPKQ